MVKNALHARFGLTWPLLTDLSLLSLAVCTDLEVFEFEVFCLRLILRVKGALCFELIYHFHSLSHGRGEDNIELFTLGRALFCVHKFHAASSSLSVRTGPPHGFGLHLHDLAWVHIVPRAIQGTGWLIVVFSFFFASSPDSFTAWFGPALADLDFWCLTRDWLVFYLGVNFHPDIHRYIKLFIGACRTPIVCRGPCLKLHSPAWEAASNNLEWVWNTRSQGDHIMVNTYCPQMGEFFKVIHHFLTQQMNSLILIPQEFIRPRRRYLFWWWSALVGKKWVIRPSISNLKFSLVSFPFNFAFC